MKINSTFRALCALGLGLVVNLCWGQDEPASHEGFFNFTWDEKDGKVMLDVTDKLDMEFLYVNSLSGGVGSNDIGLDRNQLGGSRVVKFVKSGPKVLLLEPNLDYRAISDNAYERRAVEEAFAQSVIWGFKAEEIEGNVRIDMTSFLLRDAHGVEERLQGRNQGRYSFDASRSAMNMERTRNFPKNTEFDAIITLKGEPAGGWIRSVTPTASAVTVHMHHSFVELPDDNYEPRVHDPRSGYGSISFYDYATPIDQPLEKRYTRRHRLEKQDPSAAVSDPVEPIIYYVDAGCPEPIKSALIEGASWWNQAYEAAGYRDAFIVRELPEDADPMDVRYNVINWVHRSTRGWSYGSSVTDPRTGEIIKGHVTLGSLRVRQDYMIAQGLAQLFQNGDESTDPLVQLALARLRQLSAHEVGHTLGLSHNFASSVNDRASVMDYPHPYVTMNADGTPDFSEAYDVGIGEWDKRTILFGYQDFPDGTDEVAALKAIIHQSNDMGLLYISDQDSRPVGGAHPWSHLWDNGQDPIDEMGRLMAMRKTLLESFDESVLPTGTAMAYAEQVLVPLYLNHRYQVEAVAKAIGGVDYSYAMRGDGQPGPKSVPRDKQIAAAEALLATLSPEFLAMDADIIGMIPPQPTGYRRNRELFDTHVGAMLDPLAAAEGATNHTLIYALHPHRLGRLINQTMYDEGQLGLAEYLDMMVTTVAGFPSSSVQYAELKYMVEKRVLHHLLSAAASKSGQAQVSAMAMHQVMQIYDRAKSGMTSSNVSLGAHNMYMVNLVDEFRANPESFEMPEVVEMPPGSPIGCGE